jgi:Neuraminidase (sialidase)
MGVYYSRSDNNGVSWSVPIQLGEFDEGQPAIAVYEDDVNVLWNGDAEKRGRYYRYSKNAGETWESVEILSPPSYQGGRGGLQRPPAIIVDNLGNVHALLHEQESIFYT